MRTKIEAIKCVIVAQIWLLKCFLRSRACMGSRCYIWCYRSHSLILVTGSSSWHLMAKNSLRIWKKIVALHKDGVGYKKISKTLKPCCTVAKTIEQFNRTASTQNRPHQGRPKKLSARAPRHIQRLCLGNRSMSAASIAAEVEGVGVSLLFLRPYTAHCIKLVCMAVVPEGSLF